MDSEWLVDAKSGNRFTMMVWNIETETVAQYEIRHDCSRLHCAIDCDHADGVWYFTYGQQQTGKKFDTATKLIQYYQSYPIEHEERDSRLGKPVTPIETLRILEEEIKFAELTAKKNDLLYQLLNVSFLVV